MENKDENIRKKKKLNVFLIIFLLIFSTLFFTLYFCYDKLISNNNINTNVMSDSKMNNDDSEKIPLSDDIYGYANMYYYPADGSFKEYYRIVELHKNSKDVVLASYDVLKNTVGKVDKIGFAKIVDNKLYYQLYYSSISNGLQFTYNNIMYIDLNSNKRKPVEILNWKKDEYSKTLRDYKITSNYIYFDTLGYEYYKYDLSNKKFISITESEFSEINDEQDRNFSYPDKYYLNGKELYIDKENLELIYNGEKIFKSNGVSINLFYSFDGDIAIRETTDCEGYSCNSKVYKYNFDTKTMEEVDLRKNQLFTMSIFYI